MKAEQQRKPGGEQEDPRNDGNGESEYSEQDHPRPDHWQSDPLPQGSAFPDTFSISAVHRRRLLRILNVVLNESGCGYR